MFVESFIITRCTGTLLAMCASANPGEFPDDHSVEPETDVEDDEHGPGEDRYNAEEKLLKSTS